jgi:hypothetical protein
MAGKAEILAETYRGVPAAPSRLVKKDAAGSYVWVWTGERAELRKAVFKPVGERWVILEGLPEGSVLLDAELDAPASKLKPGREVTPPAVK